MRQDADWMRRPADDSILELLRDEGNMTPLAISREGRVARADITRKYAGDRLRTLTRYGLVRRLDDGLYQITDDGRNWLTGDLDPTTLEPRDDA